MCLPPASITVTSLTVTCTSEVTFSCPLAVASYGSIIVGERERGRGMQVRAVFRVLVKDAHTAIPPASPFWPAEAIASDRVTT